MWYPHHLVALLWTQRGPLKAWAVLFLRQSQRKLVSCQQQQQGVGPRRAWRVMPPLYPHQ